MKKCFYFFSIFILLCAFTHEASAQRTDKTFSFGIGLEGAFPTGDLALGYGAGGGLTLRASYKVGPGFATLTSGAVVFTPKSFDDEDDLKVATQIPFKAGYKFIFKEYFFVMGEIGYSSFSSYGSGGNDELVKYTSSGLTFAPTIGVQYNWLELGIRYETFSVTGGSFSYTGARLGFNF